MNPSKMHRLVHVETRKVYGYFPDYDEALEIAMRLNRDLSQNGKKPIYFVEEA